MRIMVLTMESNHKPEQKKHYTKEIVYAQYEPRVCVCMRLCAYDGYLHRGELLL